MTTGGKVRALVIVVALAALAAYGWWLQRPQGYGEGFAQGNGRVEATEVDIASKTAGRVAEIFVDEGDRVTAGQVVARLDTGVLEAHLAQARALLRQAHNSRDTALAQVEERIGQKRATEAVVAQRKAEYAAASNRAERSRSLLKRNMASAQDVEDDEAQMLSIRAALEAARAQVAAAEAGIVAARSQVVGAESAIDAAAATVARLETELAEATLTAPRNARVQYRIVQPGEVIGAGGKVLSTVDLESVYMNFFLPEREAGLVRIGGEARIIIDAAPQYVFPAEISYVASVAQFTPRSVETEDERQKLMFRVKARVDAALLREHQDRVKTGLPGVVYVRLGDQPWPQDLQTRLP